MKLVSLFALVTLGLTHVGCQDTRSAQADEGSAKEQRDADEPKAKGSVATAAPTPAAPATPPEPRPVAAVREGKMVHPLTKQEVPLVEMSLAKCYGFKGYSMKVPEGAKITTLVGARACAVEFPGTKGNVGFMVMTDEVKVKWWKRTELENVKTKHLDDPDAIVYEYEEKGKSHLIAWTDTKLGPHNVRCHALNDGTTERNLAEERGAIEVCRTLRYEEPKKK
jgi:hypothetical protein